MVSGRAATRQGSVATHLACLGIATWNIQCRTIGAGGEAPNVLDDVGATADDFGTRASRHRARKGKSRRYAATTRELRLAGVSKKGMAHLVWLRQAWVPQIADPS
jgi:hypothetical protein